MLVVIDVDTSNREQAALEVCQLIEVAMQRARREVRERKVPHLYRSGAKYLRQDPSACAMRPPSQVNARGGGDCKQLVLWRIAELREAGVDAKPRIIWLNDAKGLIAHAQVRLPDGTIEDPSHNLGMRA